MIGIRADGNEEIGTGHVMRCMAIAKQIVKKGEQCVFLIADDKMQATIEESGFRTILLSTDYTKMDVANEGLEDIIEKEKINLLLIDSYYATDEYLLALRKVTKTAYIDDFQDRPYPVDLVLVYSLGVAEDEYCRMYKDNDVQFLIGTKYTPLREEFSVENDNLGDNIMITTGGTDHCNVGLNLLRALVKDARFADVTIDIVSGRYNDNHEELVKIAGSNSNVVIHHNVTKMAPIMQRARVAFSAGGTTLCEFCAMQVPTISFCIADNQMAGVRMNAEMDVIQTMGDMRDDPLKKIENGLDMIWELYNDQEKQQYYRAKMKQITDGKGAEYIAERLILN